MRSNGKVVRNTLNRQQEFAIADWLEDLRKGDSLDGRTFQELAKEASALIGVTVSQLSIKSIARDKQITWIQPGPTEANQELFVRLRGRVSSLEDTVAAQQGEIKAHQEQIKAHQEQINKIMAMVRESNATDDAASSSSNKNADGRNLFF